MDLGLHLPFTVCWDLRQALASAAPLDAARDYNALVFDCTYEVRDPSTLARVPADSHFPILSQEEQGTVYNAMFVDDDGLVAYEDDMPPALNSGVMSGHEVFGAPGIDRRGDCFNGDKFELWITESMRYLGFIIDTHHMTVTWPFDKCQKLYAELVAVLQRNVRYVSPKEMGHIIGVVRSASEVAPWGTFLSFNLENSLRLAARNMRMNPRVWWNRHKIYLSHIAVDTI